MSGNLEAAVTAKTFHSARSAGSVRGLFIFLHNIQLCVLLCSQKKRLKSGRKKLPSIAHDHSDDDYSSRRPDPVGRSYSPNGYNETERYGRIPPTRLPPMQSSLKKKRNFKKKVSVTYSEEVEF